MNRAFWITDVWKWLLWGCVPLTALLGFFTAFYFGLFVLYDRLPPLLHEPVGGFIAAFLAVIFGSLTAPSYRGITALALFVLGIVVAWQMVTWANPATGQTTVLPMAGTCVGGVAGVALIVWRFGLRAGSTRRREI